MNHKINGLRMWRMDGFAGIMVARRREEKIGKTFSLIWSIRWKNHSRSFHIQLYVAIQKQKMRNWIIIKSSSLNRAISEYLRFYYLWKNLLDDGNVSIKKIIHIHNFLSHSQKWINLYYVIFINYNEHVKR